MATNEYDRRFELGTAEKQIQPRSAVSTVLEPGMAGLRVRRADHPASYKQQLLTVMLATVNDNESINNKT